MKNGQDIYLMRVIGQSTLIHDRTANDSISFSATAESHHSTHHPAAEGEEDWAASFVQRIAHQRVLLESGGVVLRTRARILVYILGKKHKGVREKKEGGGLLLCKS